MTKMVVGKTVKIRCMRPGPCKYSDEMVYLSAEALAKMAETSYGIPVVIHHKIINSQNVHTEVVGRVADMHPGENGEWWVHMVIDDSDAADKLANGWGVSTAYRITESGAPGSFNAIPYDREVLNGTYDHVAITDTPRYEFAVDPIFYNSAEGLTAEKPQGTIDTVLSIGGNMFSKIFKRTREEIKENSAEDFIFVKADGGEVSVAALLKNEQDAEEKYNALLSRFNEMAEKYNALLKKNEEEAKEKEEKEKKENEEREAKEKEEREAKEKEEKENAMRFNSLQKAASTPAPVAPKAMSEFQKVQAGRAAYGSK